MLQPLFQADTLPNQLLTPQSTITLQQRPHIIQIMVSIQLLQLQITIIATLKLLIHHQQQLTQLTIAHQSTFLQDTLLKLLDQTFIIRQQQPHLMTQRALQPQLLPQLHTTTVALKLTQL